MISREQHLEIRRLFFAEHWNVGTISEELGSRDHRQRRSDARSLHPCASVAKRSNKAGGHGMREPPGDRDALVPAVALVRDGAEEHEGRLRVRSDADAEGVRSCAVVIGSCACGR